MEKVVNKLMGNMKRMALTGSMREISSKNQAQLAKAAKAWASVSAPLDFQSMLRAVRRRRKRF